MDEAALAERLAALARMDAPAVARFDAPDAPRGHWVVLPSAFNPPTRAHLRLLDLAVDAAGADGGAALLTTRNVDKAVEGAPLAERVGMLLAARARRPALAVLAANRARIVDQAAALEAAFPDASFDVALGHDTLARLFEPRYYDGGAEGMARALERFFARRRVIAANRGDADADAVAAWTAERAAPFADRILVVALDERHAGLSSSAARARLEAGLPCADLPDGVADRIRARGLYRPGGVPRDAEPGRESARR